ncbi:MAG TPA: SCO family protein [Candidatus Binatia bacterium]
MRNGLRITIIRNLPSRRKILNPDFAALHPAYKRCAQRTLRKPSCPSRLRGESVFSYLVATLPPWAIGVSLALLAASVSVARAHDNTRPAALREVAFEQKLNQQIPLDVHFRDESGAAVELNRYFGRKPVILNFVYYKCRDLCPLLLDGMVRALRAISFNIGDQFEVLTVSFDPSDNAALAAATKRDFVQRYGRAGAEAGWRFLTGDELAIERLSRAVGFRYQYDQQTGEFGHATGLVLLTPAGKTSRYYYGIEFSPRDLRLGLIEAAADKIGSPIDQLLLFCYHYDPVTGKYGLLVSNVIKLGGGLTVLLLGGFIFVMVRRERSHTASGGGAA